MASWLPLVARLCACLLACLLAAWLAGWLVGRLFGMCACVCVCVLRASYQLVRLFSSWCCPPLRPGSQATFTEKCCRRVGSRKGFSSCFFVFCRAELISLRRMTASLLTGRKRSHEPPSTPGWMKVSKGQSRFRRAQERHFRSPGAAKFRTFRPPWMFFRFEVTEYGVSKWGGR